MVGAARNDGSAQATGTESSRSETESVEAKVARWKKLLEDGEITPEELQKLIKELRAALADPEQRKVLEAHGITDETVDGLEKSLENLEEFDVVPWTNLLKSLDKIAGDDDATSTGPANLLNFAIGLKSLQVRNNAAEVEKMLDAAGSLGDAADRARKSPDGTTTLTEKEARDLRQSGMKAEDTDDPKLKRILNGEDPSKVKFTASELDDAEKDVSDAASRKESMSQPLMMELQFLIEERNLLYKSASELSAAVHRAKSESAQMLGQS